MTDAVRIEWSDAVATIVVDRPEVRNAIDRAAMDRLEALVAELETNDDLACVILTAQPPGFVSGGDLRDFTAIPLSEQGRAMSRRMTAIVNRLAALPCPTLAAMDGDAHGGGWELALACDIRVMARSARIAFRQAAMGLTPGWGGGQRLARLVGRAQALLLLSTAAEVTAAEALEIGLVERVVDDGQARVEGQAIGARIGEHSRLAVRNIKAGLVQGADRPLEAAIGLEGELFAETWGSPPHQAAVARFLARRR